MNETMNLLQAGFGMWLFGYFFLVLVAAVVGYDSSLGFFTTMVIGVFFTPWVAVTIALLLPDKAEAKQQNERHDLLKKQVELLERIAAQNQ